MAFLVLFSANVFAASPVKLTGYDLTLEEVMDVAEGADVIIDPAAIEQMKKSHKLLMAFAAEGRPVYGLTVGVGLNKDKSIFDADGKLSPEVIALSKQFNKNALRAHSAAYGPEMPARMVRATMVIRLNTMLTGRAAAQPYVAELYAAFLNENLLPVIPSRGTVGECDITIAPHIGLVMMGEWKADFNGKRMTGKDALKAAGLNALAPYGKDALAILSTNAPAAAQSVLAVMEADHFMKVAPKVFAMSLEGLNGNVAPFLKPVNDVRPFAGFAVASEVIREELAGSYLWQPRKGRALQDALSYRTSAYVFGGAFEALMNAKRKLTVQINSSDDNPAVVVDAKPGDPALGQLKGYYLEADGVKGAIYPTANFEPLPFVLDIEYLSIALSHVSRNAAMRTIKLSDPKFTHLSRFLAADNVAINFGAIQKPFVALDAEIRSLANPVSQDSIPVAGNIEDTATNSMRAALNLAKIVDNLYYVYGLEMFHATQAVSLRQRDESGIILGKGTSPMFNAYRKSVPFVTEDRPFSPDIQNSYEFLKGYAK